MNKAGGRLTISTPRPYLDAVFTTVVFLLVGAVLEVDALPTETSQGTICGVVASRRARGDRVELWLGGESAPDRAWIDRLKQVLARELGDPAVLTSKYKSHF